MKPGVSVRSGGLLWLRLLVLGGIFVGAGLYYTMLWWPITLEPFWRVFLGSLPLALLLLLAPLLDLLLRPRLGRILPLPASWWGALALGIALTILHVAAQLVLIERKPYLTLSQYLREEIWILWLLTLPLCLGIGFTLCAWERLAAQAASPVNPGDVESESG
jgi:hypothetical protein